MTPVTPQEPREDNTLAARRNFSVRMPEALFLELKSRSEQLGESMNELVKTAVAALVERDDLAPQAAGPDIQPKIARDAIRQGPEAIAPLKGIAKYASTRNQMALAAVCWAAAARLVTVQQGPAAGSQELSHSAAILARTSSFRELTIGLLEEAVHLDPNNLEAVNRLGQLLHHAAQAQGDNLDRYRAAANWLSRVTFIDDRARLFHGWSTLFLARAEEDQHAASRSLAEIDEAMRKWAFGCRDAKERMAWERQVERLRELGYANNATELEAFAQQHARWDEPASRP